MNSRKHSSNKNPRNEEIPAILQEEVEKITKNFKFETIPGPDKTKKDWRKIGEEKIVK